MAHAVKSYQEHQKGPKKERIGLCKICLQFQEAHFQEMGECIKLCHITLKHLAEGGETCEDANSKHAWLTLTKENIVINFITEMAAHGFSYSHKHTKEIVNQISCAQLGDKFPQNGVGLNWTYHFAKRHADWIKISWSQPQEDKCVQAGNPANDALWWEILEDVIQKYLVKHKNIYGSDKVGVQT